MIRVHVKRDGDGRIREFKVSGHAGYAERGKDIVCSAVSALVQTTIMGLDTRHGLRDIARVKKGIVECSIPARLEGNLDERVQDLVETMVMGLKAIASQYGERVEIND